MADYDVTPWTDSGSGWTGVYDGSGMVIFLSSQVVVADETLPVVANLDPVEGTELAANDPVSFDVTDDSGSLGQIIIAVTFADGQVDVAYDSTDFTTRYKPQSSIAAITDGHSFVLRRFGGWPAGTTVRIGVYAVDPSGNLNAG